MSTSVSVVRSASLNGYVALAQSLHLDAAAMLRRAGISPRSLQDPDTPLSADAVRALLEASASASGVEDFGLRLAGQRQFSNLGPIALVLQHEPTARQALDTICRYLRLLNASLLTRLESSDGLLVIREDILFDGDTPVRQATELAVGVMHRILRELLGPEWQPLAVCFRHPAPQDRARHLAFFGARVDFNAGFNGIACRAADLDAPREGGNAQAARLARDHLEQALSREHQSTQASVRQLIEVLLPGGRCTSQQVAQHLGMDRRTLHRHLASEGQTFSQLLQAVRAERVMRQLQHGQRPLAEVAALLGFSSASAFSYWFSSHFGRSVRAWRSQRPPPA